MHIEDFKLNLTSPFEADLEGKFNRINILVGENGTGKSFLLKSSWAAAYCLSNITGLLNFTEISKLVGAVSDEKKRDRLEELKAHLDDPEILQGLLDRVSLIVQFAFDNTFRNATLDGTIHFTFGLEGIDELASITIEFENGSVKNVDYHVTPEMGVIPIGIYMSPEMRTFTAANRFLSVTKNMEWMNKLDIYPMYDVWVMDKLVFSCPLLFEVPEPVTKIDPKLTEKGILMVQNNKFILVTENDEEINLETLGSGAQAMLMTLIGAQL